MSKWRGKHNTTKTASELIAQLTLSRGDTRTAEGGEFSRNQWIARIDFESPFEALHGLGAMALLLSDKTKIAIGLIGVGIQLDSFLKFTAGGSGLMLVAVIQSQVVMRGVQPRVGIGGSPEMRQALADQAGADLNGAELSVGGGVSVIVYPGELRML